MDRSCPLCSKSWSYCRRRGSVWKFTHRTRQTPQNEFQDGLSARGLIALVLGDSLTPHCSSRLIFAKITHHHCKTPLRCEELVRPSVGQMWTGHGELWKHAPLDAHHRAIHGELSAASPLSLLPFFFFFFLWLETPIGQIFSHSWDSHVWVTEWVRQWAVLVLLSTDNFLCVRKKTVRIRVLICFFFISVLVQTRWCNDDAEALHHPICEPLLSWIIPPAAPHSVIFSLCTIGVFFFLMVGCEDAPGASGTTDGLAVAQNRRLLALKAAWLFEKWM